MSYKESIWDVPPLMDLFYGMTDFMKFLWNISDTITPAAHFIQLREDSRISINDLMIVIFLAVVMTGVRHFCTNIIFKPLCRRYNLSMSDEEKMPESAWKFLFYLSTTSFTLYLVAWKHSFFQRPELMFHNWTLACEIPTSIFVLYVMHGSFYVHSVYTTLFLDTWRKDSILLLVHHLVTLLLLFYSVAFRYHNFGMMILLLHDVTDVFMEFSKINIYFKIQSGQLVKFHEVLSNVGFTVFTITWFISRLYLFPLKGIYTLTVTTNRLGLREALPILPAATFLLLVLYAMDVYWFKIILGIAVRVLTGQMDSAEDTREYDVEKKMSQRQSEDKPEQISNGYQKSGKIEGLTLTKDTNGRSYPEKRNKIRSA